MAHTEHHLKNSDFISDMVIGMSDGLTVPFALAAGLSGAVDSNRLIILAGVAEIVAGSIAMGLGGFLAGQTEEEHYSAEYERELWETREFLDYEKNEVREIFQGMGLSDNVVHAATEELFADPGKGVNFMMKYELGLEKPVKNRARKSAFNIGMAYIVGGTIPLLSYVFTQTPVAGFRLSFVITIICLLIFGYYKSIKTGQHPLKGAIKTTGIGIIAAMAAYFLVKLLEGGS